MWFKMGMWCCSDSTYNEKNKRNKKNKGNKRGEINGGMMVVSRMCLPLKYMESTIVKPRHYETLIVWQEAHKLCMSAYKIIQKYPTDERFCLCSQIRRSAYSVPMNIVEGNKKRSAKEKLHFVEHAEASLEELDYQLYLSRDLGYISDGEFGKFRSDIGKVSYLLTKFRTGIGDNM